MTKKKIVVAVSGGFAPIHPGHVRLFREAKQLGDELVVILNNNNWLHKKRGHVFMDEKERKEVLEALADVDQVIITRHPKAPEDMSVSHILEELRPDIFANGGDRDKKDAERKNSPLNRDREVCEQLGIKMVFGVGKGGKIQSSSWLLKRHVEHHVNGEESS